MEKLEWLCRAGGKVKWCSCCGKQYSRASEKVNTELPSDPAISLLGRHPGKLKAESQRDGYVYTYIHRIIHQSQKVEAVQAPRAIS